MIIFVYLLIGAFAGILGGLFGVGGGAIIVPILILTFEIQGFPSEILTHLAVGTSLATIVVTAMSSIVAHNKRGAVDWALFVRFTPGLCLGVLLGVQTASYMSGSVLQISFGIFATCVGVQMAMGLMPNAHRNLPGSAGTFVASGFVGCASAIFGIGGGSITVPFFTWCNLRMKIAVATGAACGLPIAIVGALSNITIGWGDPELPEWSMGFIYLPAFLGIIATSAFFAGVGAKLAHRLHSFQLKKSFGYFLVCLGVLLLFKQV